MVNTCLACSKRRNDDRRRHDVIPAVPSVAIPGARCYVIPVAPYFVIPAQAGIQELSSGQASVPVYPSWYCPAC